RGFDSIVQAASGIAWAESPDGERPGALPAQALDHSAGYLLAAAVTTALRRRIDEGDSWSIELSLARLAQELLAAPRVVSPRHPDFDPAVVDFPDLTVAAPAMGFTGGPSGWPTGPVAWGSSQPEWSSSSS
ncbi:MAG: CoA transferase, partial [Rhodoglobus sp.]|nr:CoA transferase [Rhodoglobus sp.]